MGIISSAMLAGAVSGVGQSLAQDAQDQQRMQDQQTLMQQQADLAQQKEAFLENLRHSNNLDTLQKQADIANAPTDDAGEALSNALQQQMPVSAPPVPLSKVGTYYGTTDDGGGATDADGNPRYGLNPQLTPDLIARIQAMPDSNPDKQGMLDQLKRQQEFSQIQADSQAQAEQGETRAPTMDEARQIALQQLAKDGNIQAIQALSALSPKPMVVAQGSTVLGADGRPIYKDTTANEIAIAKMKQDALQADKDNQVKMMIAGMTRSGAEPPEIAMMRKKYGEDSPEFQSYVDGWANSKLGGQGAGGRGAVFNGRIITSGNEIAKGVANIIEQPVGASTGMFGTPGPTSSLFSATKAQLQNQFTPEQVKTYNTMWSGISRNLGTLETSGLATTGHLIESLDKLAFLPTDNGYDALRKLAEVRQIVEGSLEPRLQDPSLSNQQKGFVQGIISSIQQSIPYTHHDLTKWENAQNANPGLTFDDYAKSLNLTGNQSQSAPTPPTTFGKTPAIGVGTDLGGGFKIISIH